MSRRHAIDRRKGRPIECHLIVPPHRLRPFQVLFVCVVSLLLLSHVLSNWPMAVPRALAAQSFAPAPPVTTYQQFVKLGRDTQYHGPVRRDLTAPATRGGGYYTCCYQPENVAKNTQKRRTRQDATDQAGSDKYAVDSDADWDAAGAGGQR